MRRMIGSVFLSGLALVRAQTAPGAGVNRFSLEKEAALGRSLAADIRRTAPAVEDPVLLAYVTRLVSRLNQYAQSPFALSAEILSPPNAEAEVVGLPGGFLLIPLRQIAAAPDEATLARSLGHALAHIVARHGTRQATRGEIGGTSNIPLIFFGGWLHQHASSRAAGEVLIPIGFRSFQEQYEAEAGALAADWIAQAGFSNAEFETGEFPAMQDRARRLLPTGPKPAPPSLLRKRSR